MHTSYVYRSTNFYICLPLCNPKQDQDKRISRTPDIYPTPLPRQHPQPKHYSDLYHYRLVLPVLNLM